MFLDGELLNFLLALCKLSATFKIRVEQFRNDSIGERTSVASFIMCSSAEQWSIKAEWLCVFYNSRVQNNDKQFYYLQEFWSLFS